MARQTIESSLRSRTAAIRGLIATRPTLRTRVAAPASLVFVPVRLGDAQTNILREVTLFFDLPRDEQERRFTVRDPEGQFKVSWDFFMRKLLRFVPMSQANVPDPQTGVRETELWPGQLFTLWPTNEADGRFDALLNHILEEVQGEVDVLASIRLLLEEIVKIRDAGRPQTALVLGHIIVDLEERLRLAEGPEVDLEDTRLAFQFTIRDSWIPFLEEQIPQTRGRTRLDIVKAIEWLEAWEAASQVAPPPQRPEVFEAPREPGARGRPGATCMAGAATVGADFKNLFRRIGSSFRRELGRVFR